MTVKTLIFIFIFVIISSENFAQTDSTSFDTESDTLIILEQDTVEITDPNKRNPTKAFIYSAVIPGLGQAYNRKYWKIPIVYSALGSVAFFFNYNNKLYKKYVTGLSELLDTSLQITIFTDNPDVTTITQYKDNFRRNRDLSALIFLAVYVLNFIDATVDAHLSDFDISDDLSLKIRPEVLPIYTQKNNKTIGLTFSLKF